MPDARPQAIRTRAWLSSSLCRAWLPKRLGGGSSVLFGERPSSSLGPVNRPLWPLNRPFSTLCLSAPPLAPDAPAGHRRQSCCPGAQAVLMRLLDGKC